MAMERQIEGEEKEGGGWASVENLKSGAAEVDLLKAAFFFSRYKKDNQVRLIRVKANRFGPKRKSRDIDDTGFYFDYTSTQRGKCD